MWHKLIGNSGSLAVDPVALRLQNRPFLAFTQLLKDLWFKCGRKGWKGGKIVAKGFFGLAAGVAAGGRWRQLNPLYYTDLIFSCHAFLLDVLWQIEDNSELYSLYSVSS